MRPQVRRFAKSICNDRRGTQRASGNRRISARRAIQDGRREQVCATGALAGIKTWPKTAIDIEESGRCCACDRYAASIFHVLLVAEFGVIEVAKLLGEAGDKPGWGALDRLDKIRQKPYPQRSALEQQHSKLLDNTVPLMLVVKESWRHKITHVDNKLEWLDGDFSPQLAEEIIKATRGLMRRLASDLP